MTVTQTRIAPPMKILGLAQAKWALSILKSALELNLFTELAAGAATAAEMAGRVKASPQGMTLLMNALVSLEFLEKKGERYQLTDISREYLSQNSDLYMGTYLSGRPGQPDPWEKLTSVIRDGKPVCQVNEEAKAEEFFPELARMIFPLNFTTAQCMADALKAKSWPAGTRVLDLAAGAGTWSIPLAQENPGVKVDALDFPAITAVTREFATKFGVEKQFSYINGNWRAVDVPKQTYDVIILGHILHCEGKALSERLLKFCHDAAKPDAQLIIAEFISNNELTGPPFAQMFAINMMVMTTDGCVFTERELDGMITDAGFKEPKRLPLPGWGEQSPVVVARAI